MKPCIIQISPAQLACEIYGKGKVTLMIEMGLGTVMAEWRHLAKKAVPAAHCPSVPARRMRQQQRIRAGAYTG